MGNLQRLLYRVLFNKTFDSLDGVEKRENEREQGHVYAPVLNAFVRLSNFTEESENT